MWQVVETRRGLFETLMGDDVKTVTQTFKSKSYILAALYIWWEKFTTDFSVSADYNYHIEKSRENV